MSGVLRHHAAVDAEHGAVDERGAGQDERPDGVGDLGGIAVAAGGHATAGSVGLVVAWRRGRPPALQLHASRTDRRPGGARLRAEQRSVAMAGVRRRAEVRISNAGGVGRGNVNSRSTWPSVTIAPTAPLLCRKLETTPSSVRLPVMVICPSGRAASLLNE